ncbi:MAG: transposase, partial [Acidobacteriota bacterium]
MSFENRIIIDELRGAIKGAFIKRGEVLMSALDALTVGPRLSRPVEVTNSPYWKYQWVSLFTGIRNGKEEQSLTRLRKRRHDFLEQYEEVIGEKPSRLGDWQVCILDATNYDQPKAETVERSFVYGAEGIKVGHWVLPLEIKLVDNGITAREFAPIQMVNFVSQHRWAANDVLGVDADYTKEPVMKPMKETGINVLGRVSHKRKFYLPPLPYGGRGRPPVRGRKIKLKDARTLPVPDASERVALESGRYCQVSCWLDVRMFAWPQQPLVLYRVVEYRADGSLRYERPLWLIYLQANGPIPTLAQAQAIYQCRF